MASEENDTQTGLIYATIFDETGKGRQINWSEVNDYSSDDGMLWVHLDRRRQKAIDWINQEVTNEEAASILLSNDTRPRTFTYQDNLLVSLRGVNLNPGSNPEDMVSIRMWVGDNRIITTRHRHIMAIDDVKERFAAGRGPKNIGDFVVLVADRLMERMGLTMENLDDRIDALETEIIDKEQVSNQKSDYARNVRSELGYLRRQTIQLRRHIAPQRDTMHILMMETTSWFTEKHGSRLREVSDHLTRYVEDLDMLRERGNIVQDELRNSQSDYMNNTLYVLTIISVILLPLGLITGLLGINVDGLPGTKNSPNAFWTVTGAMGLIAVFQFFVFKRLRWL
jgi:zinc transporter